MGDNRIAVTRNAQPTHIHYPSAWNGKSRKGARAVIASRLSMMSRSPEAI
jgi:hypothetical protein